jgi:hypothetical protein
MKRLLPAALTVIVLVAGAVFLLRRAGEPPPEIRALKIEPAAAGKLPAVPTTGAPAVASPPSPDAPAPAASKMTTPIPASELPPMPPRPRVEEESPARIEAEAIALNLRHFGQRFGGNPVGSNAEIVKTLNGGNPQGVRYLPQEYLRLNAAGELLDSFGTPYFFHQNSATEMEIRSAGPDKVMWTSDDIVAK